MIMNPFCGSRRASGEFDRDYGLYTGYIGVIQGFDRGCIWVTLLKLQHGNLHSGISSQWLPKTEVGLRQNRI